MEILLIITTSEISEFTLNKIQILKDNYVIYAINYNYSFGKSISQEKKIVDLLGDNYLLLSKNKTLLLDIINSINPNIILIEEFGETFIEPSILEVIFSNDRTYKILESTYLIQDNSKMKRWLPDKFAFVSEWSRRTYSHFGVDSDVIEYPIDEKLRNKKSAIDRLNLDPEFKHILISESYIPNYAFDIAKSLIGDKILFYFIENKHISSDKDFLRNKPDNCIIWKEKNDIDIFIEAVDLILLTSRNELSPTIIQKSLSYQTVNILMFNLKHYLGKYSKYKNIKYLKNDIESDCLTIKQILNNNKKENAISLVLTHADTDFRKKLLENCIENIDSEVIISANYPVDSNIQKKCDWFIYSKDNPLLYQKEFKEYNVNYERWYIKDGVEHTVQFKWEHGYAAYKLVKNGLDFCKNIEKEIVHVINYDYEINSLKLRENENLLTKYDIIFYKYENNAYCTGFMSGKVDALLSFFSYFKNKKEYYTIFKGDGIVSLERHIFNFYEETKYKIKEIPFFLLEKETKVNQEIVKNF